jgi:colanic acid biosynthesis glycosyl transferase WcaI
MIGLGHDVRVIAAHPHYPSPAWGTRYGPYKDDVGGIPVVRLPLWVGRDSATQRVRQEMSFAAALSLAAPFIGRPDVLVSVSPSFPALAVAGVTAEIRRVPWIVWLQDLLPDGAVATGLLDDGIVLRLALHYERLVYRAADALVLISESHRRLLLAKHVPAEKLSVITNPLTLRPPVDHRYSAANWRAPIVLNIGNIGLSQGLVPLVREFQKSTALAQRAVQLRFAGDGVEAGALRDAIRTDRVQLLGIIPDTIDEELRGATLGLVTQLPSTGEFNMPSRLMTLFGYGLPVIAVVDPRSEVARVVDQSGGGWVVDASRPGSFASAVEAALDNPQALMARSSRARAYAAAHFAPEATAREFEAVMHRAIVVGRTKRLSFGANA